MNRRHREAWLLFLRIDGTACLIGYALVGAMLAERLLSWEYEAGVLTFSLKWAHGIWTWNPYFIALLFLFAWLIALLSLARSAARLFERAGRPPLMVEWLRQIAEAEA